MPRRKVRNADDARSCLDAAERSGLTRAEWARANGVDARSLNAWRLNLGERRPRTELRLVELVSAQTVTAARYVVRCGDLAVEVDEHFDPAVLRRLLVVVASC